MGGAVSSSSCKFVAFEYERIQSRIEEEKKIDDYLHLPKLDDVLLSRRLHSVYYSAEKEGGLPFAECSNICVQAYKFANELSVDEKKSFMNNVVLATIEREQANYKPTSNADYSKSFSGSAADTKAENEAAALMKAEGTNAGSEDEDNDQMESNPYLRRASITKIPKDASPDEQAACSALRKHDLHIMQHLCGVYLKFLGPSDCFLYVHSATKEVVSLRPSEYDEELDLGGGQALANERLAVLNNPSGSKNSALNQPIVEDEGIPEGMRTCSLHELPLVLNEIIDKDQKTPLILDTTDDQKVRVFMQYKHRLQDVSALTIPFAKSGLKRTDVMEQCRKTLVGSLKTGATMALYLGACTTEHADFRKKLCKKEVFPLDIFQKAGKRLLSKAPSGEARFSAVYREEDLDAGQAVAREETFRFLVISSLHPRDYAEQLADCIPLGYLTPLYVRG